MSYKLRVEARHARANPMVYELTEATDAISVGALGDWQVEGPGVAAVHAFMYFDGMVVYFAAATGQSVTVDGQSLGQKWTLAEVPCKLELGDGGVKLAVKPPPSRRELAMQQAAGQRAGGGESEESASLTVPRRPVPPVAKPPEDDEKTTFLVQRTDANYSSEDELATVVGDSDLAVRMVPATAGPGSGAIAEGDAAFGSDDEEQDVRTVIVSGADFEQTLLPSAELDAQPQPQKTRESAHEPRSDRPRPPSIAADPERTQELDEPAARPRPPDPSSGGSGESSATRLHPVDGPLGSVSARPHEAFRSMDGSVYTSAPRPEDAIRGVAGRVGAAPAVGVIASGAAIPRPAGPEPLPSQGDVPPGSPGGPPLPASGSTASRERPPGGPGEPGDVSAPSPIAGSSRAGIASKLVAQWRAASAAQRGMLLMMPLAFAAVFVVFDESSSTAEEAAPAGTASSAPGARGSVARPPAAVSVSAPAVPDSSPSGLGQSAVGAPPSAESAAESQPGDESTERQAVDALASGDAKAALEKYRELASEHPDEEAFQVAVEILKIRTGNLDSVAEH